MSAAHVTFSGQRPDSTILVSIRLVLGEPDTAMDHSTGKLTTARVAQWSLLPSCTLSCSDCRFSLVDPWLHEKGDGFPLLYVRSHAARLPGSVVRDFLVRCKVALAQTQGRLVLKVMDS